MPKEWLTDEEERERAARMARWSAGEIIGAVLAVIATAGLLANIFIG